MRPSSSAALSAAVVLTVVSWLMQPLMQRASAEDWPGFRGPRGDGSSTDTAPLLDFGPQRNLVWKTAIPGRGHSSPVVVGDRVYVTSCLEKSAPADDVGKRQVVALDRKTGNILWTRDVFKGALERIHGENSWASATPVADDKHVWSSFLNFPDVVVTCHDREGKEVWRKSPGRFYSKHGYGCAPVAYKNLLIINCDQDRPGADFPMHKDVKGEAYIVALDKATGEQVWRIDRPKMTRSYCVPVIFEIAGRKQMILSGARQVSSYDPDTGKLLWVVDGPTEQFVSSPVLVDGLIVFTYGFPDRGLIGIKPDGTGNVTKTHVAWDVRRASRGGYVPSPLAAGGKVFLVNDEGLATCTDPKDGSQVWIQRLGRKHHASPVIVGDVIYFADDDGNVHLVKAAGEFLLLGKTELGEPCFSSPAVSDGQLFFRGTKHLFCFAKGPDTTPKE